MSFAVVQIRPQPSYRRAAFEDGLRRIGYSDIRDYICGRAWPSGPDDLLVLWNLHRGPDETYARRWETKGGTVLVCENGYLQQVDKTHYAISVHGHNGSGWFPAGDGEARFAKLGFAIKPMHDYSDRLSLKTVVRGQRGIGSELMFSPPRWHHQIAAKLRAKGVKNVVVMEHPGDKRKLEADAEALKGAGRLVIWSSAMGVRALCEGVPVDYHAPRWICGGWKAGREKALHEMACGQWHHDEIATGEPFARMKAEGWGPWTSTTN
jgi:hypothetical protein